MKKQAWGLLFLGLFLSSCAGSNAPSSELTSHGEGIRIENSSFSLALFERAQVKTNALPLGKDDLVFSSSDPLAISVDESSGQLSALKEGKATIRVSSKSEPILFDEAEFSVSRGKSLEYTYHDLNQKAYRDHSAPCKGEVSILVLPVSIKGFEENASAENLRRLDECFNSKELSRFESVSSYYEKSSYGQLKLSFKVAPSWYECGLTPEAIQADSSRDDLGVSSLSLSALNWYKDAYPEDSLTNYDLDKDGCVDGIWLIYDAPVMGADPDYYKKLYPNVDPTGFWAYTFANFRIREEMHDPASPVAKMVSWAGLGFMDEFGDGDIDAHTYIHETGHMLGLKDYYSTYSPYDCPAGCIDMMANNIGDHSAFSKFALGWVKPIVVKEAKSFYLPSFQESGEFLLLTNENWNKTPFDEYFVVEYLSPTGLNEEDYSSPYEGNGLQGYSQAGVRISHIDNRAVDSLGHYASDPQDFYNDPFSNTAYSGLTVFQQPEAKKGAMYLNRLMQKNIATAEYTILDPSSSYYQAIRFKERENGEVTRLLNPDDSLFYAGDSFDLVSSSPYRDLMTSGSEALDKYHDSMDPVDTFSYRISIENIDEGGAKISILEIK